VAFFQAPPTLGNQYDDDRVLKGYLASALPPDVLAAVQGELRELGDEAGDRLYRLQLEDRLNEPVLTQWNAWGRRVDHIEVTPLWKEAAKIAAERRSMISTGDRSAKIRTYNFPQSRVTDHRINLTLYRLDQVLAGDVDLLIDELRRHEQEQQLKLQETAGAQL